MGGSGGFGGGKGTAGSPNLAMRIFSPISNLGMGLEHYDPAGQIAAQATTNLQKTLEGKESFANHRNWVGTWAGAEGFGGATPEHEKLWQDYENRTGIYAPKSKSTEAAPKKKATTQEPTVAARARRTAVTDEEETGTTLLT